MRTDDRLTFAYGCGGGNCDRFYSDGSFDLYDYRSDNEQRMSDAVQTEITGQTRLAGLRHDVGVSVTRQRLLDRPSDKQAYNWAGTGNIDGTSDSPQAQPTPGDLNTNRSEYATEIALRDRIEFNTQTAVWVGLRHTALSRSSAKTDGSQFVSDQRSINAPWLAATHKLTPNQTIYASYGEGIESEVTPNKTKYTNAGQALPALRSKQFELGFKSQTATVRWQATLFDVRRPQSNDARTDGNPSPCDNAPDSCTRKIDGQAHHRGLELSGGLTHGQWNGDVSAAWIDAKRQNAEIDPSINGQTALNVPRMTLRALAQYRFTEVPGLRSSLRLSHEGERRVLENGSITLPAWTTVDFATHYDTRIDGTRTQWTLAINNLADRHYWRESPKQFGHYYLYPGAPRTLRLAVKASF